jgi:uncharacterized membrane protein
MEGFACFFVAFAIAGFIYLLIRTSGKATREELEALKSTVDFLESKLKVINDKLIKMEKSEFRPPAEPSDTAEKPVDVPAAEAIPAAIPAKMEVAERPLGLPPGEFLPPIAEVEMRKEEVPVPEVKKEEPAIKDEGELILKTETPPPIAKEPQKQEPVVILPKPSFSKGWEKKIGISLAVWVGSIAIAISGAFLVKYSIERGMLTDTMKVALATILGAVLLFFGEFLRKKTFATAQGASAAGIAVLYASFLAATAMYKMFSPALGFSLLCIVTAAAVALSLRQGIIVAIIGLIGGFFTPYLIGTISTDPAKLFIYVILLQAALVFVSQKRQWRELSFLTLIMGFASVFHRFFGSLSSVDTMWIGGFVLVSTALFVMASKRFCDAKPQSAYLEGHAGFDMIISYFSTIGALVALAVLAIKGNFSLYQWLFLAILAAATIALAALDNRYNKLPFISFVLLTVLIAGWAFGQLSRAHSMSDVFLVCGGLLIVYGIIPFFVLLGSKTPTYWAILSCLGGVASFMLAWGADKTSERVIEHWGIVTISLAVIYLLMTLKCRALAAQAAYFTEALASYCVATTIFISYSVPLELKREWITVAWALETFALGWLLYRFRIKIIGYLALIVSVLTAARLLLNPQVLKYPIGTMPLLNWLLYGYGIPALAFAFASTYFRKSKWFSESRYLAWLSGAFSFALLTLEVRHYFHPGIFPAGKASLLEWATYSNVWLLAGFVLFLCSRIFDSESMVTIGSAYFWISGAKIVLVDILFNNPVWSDARLGELPLLNWLLYLYFVPIAIMILARHLYLKQFAPQSAVLKATYLLNHLLAFVLLTLEIRHFFHPEALNTGKMALTEIATYGHFWLLLAALFFIFHLKFDIPFSAEAGKVILTLALCKIIFLDLISFNPAFSHYGVGSVPVLNWLIYIYLVPVILLYLIFKLSFHGDAFKDMGPILSCFSMFLGAAFLTLEARQYFHGNFLDGGKILLNESATFSHLWILLAALLFILGRKFNAPFAAGTGKLLVVLAVGKIVLCDIFIFNPIFMHHDVGVLPVMNWLIYVYLLPILLLYLLFKLPGDGEELKDLRPYLLYFSMFLSLFFLTLEVRQFFHGGFMDEKIVLQKENYAYSVAWIVYSFALLIFGVVKKNRFSRMASLAVIYLAVTKVFVYDLRHLKDLYRVASFLALGISLLVISYLYQRFVFGEKEK